MIQVSIQVLRIQIFLHDNDMDSASHFHGNATHFSENDVEQMDYIVNDKINFNNIIDYNWHSHAD